MNIEAITRGIVALMFIIWSSTDLIIFFVSVDKKRDFSSLFFAIGAGGIAAYYIYLVSYSINGLNDSSLRDGFRYLLMSTAVFGGIGSIMRLIRRYHERNYRSHHYHSNFPIPDPGSIHNLYEITETLKRWERESGQYPGKS